MKRFLSFIQFLAIFLAGIITGVVGIVFPLSIANPDLSNPYSIIFTAIFLTIGILTAVYGLVKGMEV